MQHERGAVGAKIRQLLEELLEYRPMNRVRAGSCLGQGATERNVRIATQNEAKHAPPFHTARRHNMRSNNLPDNEGQQGPPGDKDRISPPLTLIVFYYDQRTNISDEIANVPNPPFSRVAVRHSHPLGVLPLRRRRRRLRAVNDSRAANVPVMLATPTFPVLADHYAPPVPSPPFAAVPADYFAAGASNTATIGLGLFGRAGRRGTQVIHGTEPPSRKRGRGCDVAQRPASGRHSGARVG